MQFGTYLGTRTCRSHAHSGTLRTIRRIYDGFQRAAETCLRKTIVLMAEASQAEFARAARGAQVTAGEAAEVEPVVLGVSSVARTAVRRVHQESPLAARAYFSSKVSKWLLAGGRAAATAQTYRGSLDRYIAWDGGSGDARLDVGFRESAIFFAPGDGVRALAHVVRDLGGGQREARVLLWDDLPLDRRSAEMIALPVIERVDRVIGAGSTATVGVWQLAMNERIAVQVPAAQARRPEVLALLATL